MHTGKTLMTTSPDLFTCITRRVSQYKTASALQSAGHWSNCSFGNHPAAQHGRSDRAFCKEKALRTPRTIPAAMGAMPVSAALLLPVGAAECTGAEPLPSNRCRFALQTRQKQA